MLFPAHAQENYMFLEVRSICVRGSIPDGDGNFKIEKAIRAADITRELDSL
jgi:hypothetical protein